MRIEPLLIFFLLSSLAAAAKPDSLSIEDYRGLALAFLEENCLDSVAHYQQLGARLGEREDNLEGWISLHRRIGQNFRGRRDYALALQYFAPIFKSGWREPCTNEEYRQLAWAHTDLGYTYKQMNAIHLTADHYQKAADIFRDRLGESDTDMAAHYIYSELGNAYSRLRDYHKAEFYLGKRKDILEQAGRDRAARAFNDLGMLYSNQEQYARAALIFEEGLAVEGVSLSNSLPLLTNLGFAYYQMGELEEARRTTLQAKARVDNSSLPQSEKEGHLVWVYENLARICKADNDFLRSEQHYNEALGLAGPGSRRSEALLRIGRAGLYLQMGLTKQSLKDYHQAIQLFLPDFRDTSTQSLPTVQLLAAEPNLIEALGGKARCFRAQFRATAEDNLLRKALDCYMLAGQAELLLHQFYVMEGARLTAVKEHRWIREEALETAFELWRTDPSPELEGRFFTLMESNRAMLLLEALKATGAAARTPGIYGRYEKSRDEAADLEEALYTAKQKGADKAKLDSLNQRLMLAKEQKATATRELLSGPAGFALPTSETDDAISTIRQALGEGQMLLEYFLGSKNVYLTAISKEGFKAWKIEFSPAIKEHALALREVWSGQPMLKVKSQKPRFARSAHLLFQWLLADALAWKPKDVNRLVIVTDGSLGYIPFEILLQTEPEDGFHFANLDYMARDFSISYAPSAGLFVLQTQREAGHAAQFFAGFAPDYSSDAIAGVDTSGQQLANLVRSGNYELKGAKEEVKLASQLFKGTPFTGLNASERVFKEQAGDFRLLLLSMHSLVNEDNPGFSRLLFTSGASMEAEDDLLHALELSSLTLRADLAVLSACNTGYGKVYEGEGVMSLSRAFFLAGVPSTVMTLWKIPDAQSSALVLAFFENLRSGMPKDVALQQAKLSFLKNLDTPEEAHPYFWAGFITAGNTRPLEADSGSFNKWLLWGAVLMVFVSLTFYGFRMYS